MYIDELEFIDQMINIVIPSQIRAMNNNLLGVQQVALGRLKGIHLSILSEEDAVSFHAL